MKMRNNL